MAPTVRQMLATHLPDRTFRSAEEVIKTIPQSGWDLVEQTFQHGMPESHYLKSRAAGLTGKDQTPGLGQLAHEAQQAGQMGQAEQEPGA